MLANLRQAPHPAASRVRYRTLAARHDASCRRLVKACTAAVAALAIRLGDTVFAESRGVR